MTNQLLSMDAALRAESVRLHRAILVASMAASSVMGACIGILLWDSGARAMLPWWLAALACVLGMRLAVGWRQQQKPDAAPNGEWLRWHRFGYAAHGLVWGVAGLTFSPVIDQPHFNLLVFAIVAMGAGGLILAAFDVVAALAFAVPAVAPMVVQLLLRRDGAMAGWWIVALLLLGAALISALRTQRLVREAVRLRLTEHAHAERARHSAEAAERARLELVQTNLLLPVLLETTQQGFWAIDNEGITTNINPAMCGLLGRPRDEIMGRAVFDFVDDADAQVMREQLRARQRGETAGYEISLRRPDGSWRYCYNNATPLVDAAGNKLGSVGLWTDITVRREVELALRTYELVANSLTDMVSVIDEDEVYRMVNDAWCRGTGVTRADALGRSTIGVMPVLATPARRQAMRECMELRQVRVVRALVDLPGLRQRHVESTYYPYPAVAERATARCVVIVSRDVTEQEEARQQLVLGAEYLRRTLNATGDAIFASDAENPDEPARFSNTQMRELWGIGPDYSDPLTPAMIMAHAIPLFADPQGEVQRVAQIIASGEPHESQVRLRDGRILLRRCVPARVAGRVVRVWSFRDITAQERALNVVKDAEMQQRALIDAFPGFIARLDERLVYTHVNDRLARRLGMSPQQMVGHSVGELLGAQQEAQLRQLIAGLQADQTVNFEHPHLVGAAAGTTDQVTLAKGVDPASGRPVIYSFGIDITPRKQAEEQLRVTSAQLARKTHELQLTLDNIEQGIVSLDADGRVEVVNRRVLELLDLPPSLLGPASSYDEVVRYQAAQGDLGADHGFVDIDGRRRYFEGGRANSPAVYVRRTKSGRVIEVRTRQMPGGGLVRTFADVTDYVDAQQALRDGEAELRSLLDAIPGYIAATNQDGIYTYVNEQHAALMGMPASAISGHHVREVVGEERFQFNRELAYRARDRGPTVQELVYPGSATRAALALEVTYVAGPLKAGGAQTFYGFGQDVTARKAAEEALIAARDAAESASRAKSEFLASMSHELRTPLNAILGFSELFRLDQSLPAQTREGAAEIERAGRHLLALVDDVIDLARIEAGRLDLVMELVDVGMAVAQCVALVEPLARKRGIAVRRDADAHAMVSADRLRLRQVMLNLLSNAIKYNRALGTVQVRVAEQLGTVRISVADTGEGIAPELRPRVFSSFDRLGEERGQIEGAGIGLVITKRIVEAMGGTIGFDSEAGVGSVFWVQLPAARGFLTPTPTVSSGTHA